jgi:hypothetical protein
MSSIQGLGPMQGSMGMMGMGGMGGPRGSATLTDDQKTTLTSILSKYDPDNLTAEDAQSIFEQLAKAGIQPGKGMKEAIEAAGFDAENLRTLAMQGSQQAQGMQGPPPPPPVQSMQSGELTDDQKSTVASILAKYDSSNVTTSDAISIFKELKDAGITPMKGLKEAIDAAGFNADELRSTAMSSGDSSVESYFWASQKTSQSINTSTLQSLKSILDQYDLSNLSTDDQTSLYSALQSVGLFQSGSLLNTGA